MDGKIFVALPQHLQDSALSLSYYGSEDEGWVYHDVREVINVLTDQRYAILGGDVWKREQDTYSFTYDNWFLNWDDGDSFDAFVQKSREKALSYVQFYFERNGDDYCYTVSATSHADAAIAHYKLK